MNIPPDKIKRLPKNLYRYGFKYSELERTEDVAIYKTKTPQSTDYIVLDVFVIPYRNYASSPSMIFEETYLIAGRYSSLIQARERMDKLLHGAHPTTYFKNGF